LRLHTSKVFKPIINYYGMEENSDRNFVQAALEKILAGIPLDSAATLTALERELCAVQDGYDYLGVVSQPSTYMDDAKSLAALQQYDPESILLIPKVLFGGSETKRWASVQYQAFAVYAKPKKTRASYAHKRLELFVNSVMARSAPK